MKTESEFLECAKNSKNNNSGDDDSLSVKQGDKVVGSLSSRSIKSSYLGKGCSSYTEKDSFKSCMQGGDNAFNDL